MLKPFMRLFGIDDDGEPDSLPPQQRGLDVRNAQPVAQASIMLGERDELSEPDKPADARR